jgi:hypothetical protein
LHVERGEFPCRFLGRAVPVKVVRRTVEDDVERLALGKVHRLCAEDRDLRRAHAGRHEVALVTGEDFAVTVRIDRGEKAQLAQRQLDQVESRGVGTAGIVSRWGDC